MGFLLKLVGGSSTTLWLILSAIAFGAASGGGIAWKVQGYRLDALQNHFDKFVAEVKAKGEAAQIASDAQKKSDQLKKEAADHENSNALATLAGTIGRLRIATDSRGSVLPPAPASSVSPAIACLDRAESERAFRDFLAEARGLTEEGDKATIDLNTAKLWATNFSLK
jgi:hypothetical protein